ncbi:MAG TPA: DsbA family protein [Thermoleophilaceae bacterium]|nr:DsbA family protein [Thermoleophilaceae bacterium]
MSTDHVSPAEACITEFTDPGCPWAYSAEPFRRRLEWLYGDRIEWRVCLVGLSETPEDYLAKGFTPEKQAQAFNRIARDHGMPIDTSERPRMAATVPACRAVVAARRRVPERERMLLRRLHVRTFSGELLDEPDTIAGAASDAGLEPGELEEWCA